MEGIEAFISDSELIRMRHEAGVDTDSQEVVRAVSEYHIFKINALVVQSIPDFRLSIVAV